MLEKGGSPSISYYEAIAVPGKKNTRWHFLSLLSIPYLVGRIRWSVFTGLVRPLLLCFLFRHSFPALGIPSNLIFAGGNGTINRNRTINRNGKPDVWPGLHLVPDPFTNSASHTIKFAGRLACVYFSTGLEFRMESAMIYCPLKTQHYGRVVILFF